MNAEELRLQVFLARSGLTSRRGGEDMIREGRVKVNGERAELGSKVLEGRDVVTVDGRRIALQKPEWVALHKPKGYVSTRDDPEGRRTVYDLLPAELHHLFHVGRLDRDSTGLILLTNDGETANLLLHPRYGTEKEYLADVEGEPTPQVLRRLVKGVELDDGTAHAVSAQSLGELDDGYFQLRLTMREGRRREVRRMLEAVGLPVKRLFRRSFGPIEVGRLRSGHWRYLTEAEIGWLRRTGAAPEEEAAPKPRQMGGPRKRAAEGGPRKQGGPAKRAGRPVKRVAAESGVERAGTDSEGFTQRPKPTWKQARGPAKRVGRASKTVKGYHPAEGPRKSTAGPRKAPARGSGETPRSPRKPPGGARKSPGGR
jgi:23S rRNA pseudouridine2605 synthase